MSQFILPAEAHTSTAAPPLMSRQQHEYSFNSYVFKEILATFLLAVGSYSRKAIIFPCFLAIHFPSLATLGECLAISTFLFFLKPCVSTSHS